MGRDSIAVALREKGYRLTPQRLMILEAVQGSENHISAEDIYQQVHSRYPHINVSTIYRTLDLLREQRLVTETDLGEGHLGYHPVEDSYHHHLVCRQCGTIQEVDDTLLAPVRDTVWRKYGFRAEIAHHAIFGRCAKCQG